MIKGAGDALSMRIDLDELLHQLLLIIHPE